jgi:hypothetical protein
VCCSACVVCDEDATAELRVKTVKYFKGIQETMVRLISSHLISSHLISSHLISSHLISSHLTASHL